MNTFKAWPQRRLRSNDKPFESTITEFLQQDCYEQLIRTLGEEQAQEQMEETWKLIEAEMRQMGTKKPIEAARELFRKSNYNGWVHTKCYAAIYCKARKED